MNGNYRRKKIICDAYGGAETNTNLNMTCIHLDTRHPVHIYIENDIIPSMAKVPRHHVK